MRQSNKARNRKNNSRRNNLGNVVNRVFDSAGPEGRVRGTPQQVIDKYLALAHDATLSGDRVAAENFLQHAEHYTRLLAEAQREQAERQAEHQRQRAEQSRDDGEGDDDGGSVESDVIASEDAESTLVETPEDTSSAKPRSRRAPRRKEPEGMAVEEAEPAQPAE